MPGSSTTQDRGCARVDAHSRFAFRCDNGVGVPIDSFATQWEAYTHACRRFAPGLAADDARLGADVVRYSFIAVDLHHLLLAGLPAHCHRNSNPLEDRAFTTLTAAIWQLRARELGATIAKRLGGVDRKD